MREKPGRVFVKGIGESEIIEIRRIEIEMNFSNIGFFQKNILSFVYFSDFESMKIIFINILFRVFFEIDFFIIDFGSQTFLAPIYIWIEIIIFISDDINAISSGIGIMIINENIRIKI